MKICKIVGSFQPLSDVKGDLESDYYFQAKLSKEAGFDMHVVCARKEHQKEYENIEGVHVHRVAPITSRRSYLFGDFAEKCLSKVKEINPDMIHGHTTVHFGCVWNRRKLNIPILSHFHVMLDSYKKMDYLPLNYSPITAISYRLMIRSYFYENKYILKNSDHIIAVSRASMDSIRKSLPDKDIRAIYNGFNAEHFMFTKSDLKEKLNADYLLLYVGRPVPLKGIQYLLAATKHLSKDFKNLKLLLLGVDRSDSIVFCKWLRYLARKKGLNNVIFSKAIPHQELSKYYSAADCFVLPSTTEGLPCVILEALACGCPVVATNAGGIPEIFGTDKRFLCEPRSIDELVDKIGLVLRGEIKTEFIDFRNFTWERNVKEILNYYEDINSGKS